MQRTVAVLVALLVTASCGGGSATGTTDPDTTIATAKTAEADDGVAAEQRFPDVIDARATADGDAWNFHVTISSPYDTPARYADAWRVLGPDGTEFGVRVLTHDHASEQPFTRSLSGVEIPADVDVVTIEGRDLVNGWGGTTFAVRLPRP